MHDMVLGVPGNQELYWNWKCLNVSRLAIVRIKSEVNVYGERTFIESEVRREMAKWNKISFIFNSEESFFKKLNE